MSQQFLYGPQIGAFREHVRSKRVAQSVRMHVWRQAFGHGNLLHNPSHTARGQRAAALVDQKPSRALARHIQQFLPRLAISRQCLSRCAFQRHITLLFSFAPDQNHSIGFFNIVQSLYGATGASASLREYGYLLFRFWSKNG